MAEREREAEALMDEVRAQAERMVARTDIVRQANRVAQRILDDANEEARRMRHETEDYCDQRLAGHGDRARPDHEDGPVGAPEAAGHLARRPSASARPRRREDESDAESFFDQDER